MVSSKISVSGSPAVARRAKILSIRDAFATTINDRGDVGIFKTVDATQSQLIIVSKYGRREVQTVPGEVVFPSPFHINNRREATWTTVADGELRAYYCQFR